MPEQAYHYIKINGRNKQFRNLTEAESELVKDQYDEIYHSAWYISQSHDLLRKANVDAYAPTARVSEKEVLKRLEAHLENPKPGKSGANLTLALNDSDNVHNVEMHRAVYKRLKAREGDQVETEEALRDIGRIFRAGNVPTETSYRRTRINDVVK